MHRTLKQETALPPRSSLKAQKIAFDKFVQEYNFERPHKALEFATPGKLFTSSNRKFPTKILGVAYPANMVAEKVYESGFSQYGPHRIFLGTPLVGEIVGFEEISERLCRIYFTNAVPGVLDLFTGKIMKYQKPVFDFNEMRYPSELSIV